MRVRTMIGMICLVVAGCAPLGLVQPGTPDKPEVLAISLTDTSVDVWPAVVARGKIGLALVNDGQLEHGFRIVGPGVNEGSDEFLTPGQRRLLWVDVAPGTFRLFCPDGDHAARGMSASLVVTDRPSWFRR